MSTRRAVARSVVLLWLAGCARTQPAAVVKSPLCVVFLHGKGQRGGNAALTSGRAHLFPEGNGSAWGGREWVYFPAERLEQVRQLVAATVAAASCEKVVLHGFSNGASAAAKLVCSSETLGGKLVGAIIDDPVVDHGVDGCKPAPSVKLRLYVTGALTQGVAGASCKALDWTCEGGTLLGLEAYARALGVLPAASTSKVHAPQPDPPEYAAWL